MAVGVTSSIVYPYKRDHRIDDGATEKNGEAVFTHSSPRSSAPGTDRGTPAAIGSAGPVVTELRTGWALKEALKEDVQVRARAQPCHSVNVYRSEWVLKWLNKSFLA